MGIDPSHFLAEFNERGFLVFDHPLGRAGGVLSTAADRFIERHPVEGPEWVKSGIASHQARDLLPKTADFDVAVENPFTLGFARALFGVEVTFEHLSLLIRDRLHPLRGYPGTRPSPSDPKGWHRDNTRDYDRRHEIGAISVIHYLTDVTEADHCFSIIPETHNRRVDLRPEDVLQEEEVDVIGPAGTTILFHARCIHSGKVRPRSRQRRTLHLYYWRTGKPRTSDSSTIPPRLYEKRDPSLPPHLYSKWHVAEVLDRIGRTRG